MRQVRYCLTTIEDMHAYGLFGQLQEFFDSWRDLINEGYIIVLYRDFTNAPSEIIERITTQVELSEFVPRFLPA